MSTIEQDAERVRAVRAVLEQVPQVVWVARWQNRHGDGFMLFASEEGARTQLVNWLIDEWEDFGFTEEEYLELRQKIVGGSDTVIHNDGDAYYSFDSEVVHP